MKLLFSAVLLVAFVRIVLAQRGRPKPTRQQLRVAFNEHKKEDTMDTAPFVWKDQEITTLGETLSVVSGIIDRDDKQEAQEFLAAYREFSKHADNNIGYGLGYLGHDQMVKGLRLFDVRHPVFGGADEAAEVTPAQAFKAGMDLGEQMRRDAED